jgi:hypothetical protein
MLLELDPLLRRAPAPPYETGHVISEHRGRVIEREQRISADLLHLPLPDDGRPPAQHPLVTRLGIEGSDQRRVIGMGIRSEARLGIYDGPDRAKEAIEGGNSVIRSRAVLPTRDLR